MVTTTISATVTWKDGNRFVGRSGSGHEVEVEGPSRSGVPVGASTPSELALIALATCSGVVVTGVLTQGGESLRGLEIDIEATLASGSTRRIDEIRLRYRVTGDLPEEKVARAIDLSSDAFCLLKDMLGAKAQIKQEYEVKA